MGNAHAIDHKIENPGVLKGAKSLDVVFGLLVAIGLVSFFVLLSGSQEHAWSALLRAHFYFLGLSVCALFFVVLQWITSSMWSAPVRRVAESFTAYIPVILVSTLLVFLGSKHLFQWTNLDKIKGDAVVEGKLGYLNMTFFVIRTLVAVGGWILFSRKIVGASLRSDSGVPYQPIFEGNRKLGVAFLAFFAITFSMSAFDQLMSLDPHFFSTMFGVYTFAGSYQTFFAMFAIVVILLKRAGYLGKVVNENHLHDIAKFMFAFTVFWAYTGFSQYMLIWYANLPEETGYFLLRFNDGWTPWTISLFVGKFFMPFFLLLPRGNKRSEVVVFMTACWILGMQYLDLNWMIQPQIFSAGPQIHWGDVGVWFGFLGMFGFMVTRFLKKNNVVAIKDPFLSDSVFHHHI
jgi:hypothetical protein